MQRYIRTFPILALLLLAACSTPTPPKEVPPPAITPARPATAKLPVAANAAELEIYERQVRTTVAQNVVLPPDISGNPEVVVNISQLPSGEVLAVRLLRSSGSGLLDAAVVRAIQKSSPLPKPADPSLFQRDLIIKYRPFAE